MLLPIDRRLFDLMQYDAESLEDTKAYIAKRTSNSASKAREAVSRGPIAKSAGETDLKVEQVLKKWDSFLRRQQVSGDIRYSIYHNSLGEFMAKDETVQSAGVDVE